MMSVSLQPSVRRSADTPSPGSVPALVSSLFDLGRCEMRGCPDEAVAFNDDGEALCQDHLHDWAIGQDDGEFLAGEFDE